MPSGVRCVALPAQCLERGCMDPTTSKPVEPSLPTRLLMGLVRGYRLLLSPWLGSSCRFEPTCSAYSLEALRRHGAATGTRLTVWRILRCHPWCDGGHDPVPERAPGLFTSLLPCEASPPEGENPPSVTTDLRKKSL